MNLPYPRGRGGETPQCSPEHAPQIYFSIEWYGRFKLVCRDLKNNNVAIAEVYSKSYTLNGSHKKAMLQDTLIVE